MGENIKINNLLVNNNNSNSSTLFLFHLVEVCFVCPPPMPRSILQYPPSLSFNLSPMNVYVKMCLLT